MKPFIVCLSILLLSKTLSSQSIESTRIHLPNGWSLTPIGTSLHLGDLPLNIAVANSKKYIAVTNNGQSTQTIQLINILTKKVVDNIVIPKSWYGLKFSNNDQYLYASAGNDNMI